MGLPPFIYFDIGFLEPRIGIQRRYFFHAHKSISDFRIKPYSRSRSSGSSLGAVCIIKFQAYLVHIYKSLSKKRAEEHVRLSGLHRVQVESHAFHDIKAISQRTDNALLAGPEDMPFIMLQQIQSR